MGSGRLCYIDQLKGVAIFFMVMGHVALFAFGMETSMVQAFGVANMPMFFFASGFLAYREMRSGAELGERLVKRGRRLLIPWICVTVAMCLYGGREFVPTLMSFYWFFYMLVLLTLSFCVYEYFVARHFGNAVCYVGSFLLMIAVVGLGYYSGLQGYRFPFAEFVVFATSYLLGWCCRKFRGLNDFCLGSDWLPVVCVALFAYGCCNVERLNLLTRVLAGNAGVLMWQSVLYHWGKRAVEIRNGGGARLGIVVGYMGQCSLSIYMLNNFLIPDLRQWGSGFLTAGNGFFWQFVIIGVLTVPVIVGCVLVREMVKDNRYLKWIFC